MIEGENEGKVRWESSGLERCRDAPGGNKWMSSLLSDS